MEEYRQWVQNTENAKILSKNFRMWSFVQHSIMLEVLNFNAGMMQGNILLGYEATSTVGEFHACDGNALHPCSRVLLYDRNSRAGLDETAQMKTLIPLWDNNSENPSPNFINYTKYSKNLPCLTTLSTVTTTLA
jgi:hypothetical protein